MVRNGKLKQDMPLMQEHVGTPLLIIFTKLSREVSQSGQSVSIMHDLLKVFVVADLLLSMYNVYHITAHFRSSARVPMVIFVHIYSQFVCLRSIGS